MRQEDYYKGILGALGAGEDNGVPRPIWRHEVYYKAIYDALKGNETSDLLKPAYRQEVFLKAIHDAIKERDISGRVSTIKALLPKLRAGKISESVAIGDPFEFARESGVYVTVSGVTATVDEDTFISKVNNCETAVYEFVYDGAAWHLDDMAVEPSVYGLTINGSPQSGSLVAVHVQSETIVMEVAGFDCDVPVETTLTHSLTLLSRDILTYGTIAYCAPQALISVTTEIPAGTKVYVHGDRCNYSANINGDGDYALTPTVTIPAGGKIRHSALGVAGKLTKEDILAGVWTTYDANYNQLETNLATIEDNTGLLLGTVTSNDPQYLANGAAHVNFTHRNAYGSNRSIRSAQLKWMNSAAKGAASGQIASWWTASDEFDMPIRSTLPGLLHGLDSDLVESIAPVWKRTAKSITDGYGYEDTQARVFAPSMTEVGFGNNNNVVETSPRGKNGDPNFTVYPLYENAINDDRIKYSGTIARNWFTRSPYSSFAYFQRYVNLSGTLSGTYSSNDFGAVAGLSIA